MGESIFNKINRKLRTSLSIPNLLFSKLVCMLRSHYYSRKIDSGGGKILVTQPFINFKLDKHPTSHLKIVGKFRIKPHIGGNSPVVLEMGKNSKCEINGDFIVGQGVRIHLSTGAILTIGGKEKESDSGITADTLLMVNKKLVIGKDFLCSWNVYITDSDWHTIDGKEHQQDVIIGDHVWVANNNNILKGTVVGNNCIIGSCSKLGNVTFGDNLLIGGTPAKVLKNNVLWNRDIN